MALGSLQAAGMGKPNNLFAARKQLNNRVATAPATHPSKTKAWHITREVKCQITLLGKLVETISNYRRYLA
ncbi:hypothetical protein GCM10023187_28700 [Nibrella viscosa]|uniref:Transposase n=2 Tax=Nibrella viscosa TaxID=1084524 RepID=A0ABP8KJY1_9BACT